MTKKKYTIQIPFPINDIDLWQRLVVGLRYENRFSLARETAHFVESLLEYAAHHKSHQFTAGTSFFRARINDTRKPNEFNLLDMGAPPKEKAGHGRLNPKGIPYLYLASDNETAVSEIRPWVGCTVTVAKFNLKKEVNLINLSNKHFVDIPDAEEYDLSETTWRQLITWMFSAPFDPRDDTAYIPTQYLSERIKGAGFDGIMYDSALKLEGYNVTLFDPSSAEPKSREHAHVSSIKIRAIFTDIG